MARALIVATAAPCIPNSGTGPRPNMKTGLIAMFRTAIELIRMAGLTPSPVALRSPFVATGRTRKITPPNHIHMKAFASAWICPSAPSRLSIGPMNRKPAIERMTEMTTAMPMAPVVSSACSPIDRPEPIIRERIEDAPALNPMARLISVITIGNVYEIAASLSSPSWPTK